MDFTTMPKTDHIIIQQTLHGYKNGHKLLSSSTDLSDIEKRTMLMFSDYSGSGIESGFLSYVTGYPLQSSKFYVFAKTWYAKEMTRPGCVWTHSLLIDFTDLWGVKNMKVLLDFFKRPESSTEFSGYSQALLLNSSEQFLPNDLTDIFYNISCELYGNSDKGLVVLGNSSTQFETEVLQIWNYQWPRMKRSFTFSTGSLSLRKYEGLPFDIQILPYKRERVISFSENETFKIIDSQNIQCKNDWIANYKNLDFKELQQFMVKYGSDVLGNRANFISLLSSFEIVKSLNSLNVDQIEKFFKINFSDPTQAKVFKTFIIDYYFKNSKKEKFSLVQLLISHKSFSNVQWDFSKIIRQLWQNHQVNQGEIINLINQLIEKKFENDVLLILRDLDPFIWIQSNLNTAYYIKLLDVTPELEMNPYFWTVGLEIQEQWYQALQQRNTTNWSNVINAMLEANSDLFAKSVYEHLGQKALPVLVGWLMSGDRFLPSEWKYIIRENQESFFFALTKEKNINSPLLKLALEIFLPLDELWKTIPVQLIEFFLITLNKTKIEPESTGFYTFFITASYTNNLSDPIYINNLIFQTLHDRLQDNYIDFNSWERFKWNMGRDVYGLIEQNYFSKIFNDRNSIPDWDNCEFLRRAMVVTFLKYNWDPSNIAYAVRDRSTFEKIVDFAIQTNEGYKLVKQILRNIESSEDLPFHHKVLKRALK
jgi:hypothetical protein